MGRINQTRKYVVHSAPERVHEGSTTQYLVNEEPYFGSLPLALGRPSRQSRLARSNKSYCTTLSVSNSGCHQAPFVESPSSLIFRLDSPGWQSSSSNDTNSKQREEKATRRPRKSACSAETEDTPQCVPFGSSVARDRYMRSARARISMVPRMYR